MVIQLSYFRSLHVTRKNKLRNGVKERNGCDFIIDKKCRKHRIGMLIIILNE
jgi:hypothetical protein